jgi:hypothetical protein
MENDGVILLKTYPKEAADGRLCRSLEYVGKSVDNRIQTVKKLLKKNLRKMKKVVDKRQKI